MLLGSISSQQRFGATDIKALSVSQLSGLGQTVLQLLDKSVLQLRVTALFYLDNNRKIHPQGVRACRFKDAKRRVPQRTGERERERALWLLFLCFSFPRGPALCKLGQPGVLFVLPEVLTPVLGPSFVLFSWAFLFLIFQPPPFGTPFPYSNYLTLPNWKTSRPLDSLVLFLPGFRHESACKHRMHSKVKWVGDLVAY